jgi:nickel-dependent lactate racemase
MPIIQFPFGKELLSYNIPEARFKGELISRLHSFKPAKSQESLVDESLSCPIGTSALHELSKGKKKIVLIASDHTRPVPSKIIVPRMLAEIRKGNPGADITILIATGCHRETTKAELEAKFGLEIMKHEKIIIHDCDSPDMAYLGKLPSGGDLVINKLAAEADLLLAEGFIEPHFFAGFSGGRKSVLPGIAGRKTVVYNHNAEFIAHPLARTGILEGNPIHIDMLYAARKARLAFICNVVINAHKEVIFAVSGDCELAHKAGSDFLASKCHVSAVNPPADIAIVTNGGYPLDQNIYQAVKGMTSAEAAVRKGGVIIQVAASGDGHGAREFHKTFVEEKNRDRMLDTFMQTPRETTRVDQWQSQIFARVLNHARVIYISKAPDRIVGDLHMIPARSIDAAVKMAEEYLGNKNASIVAIPDGVSVIVN